MNLKTLTTSDLPAPGEVYRPYYNQKNADAVRGVFDDLISKPRSVFVSAAELGLSNSTLQNRILYGLMWLIENNDPERKYRWLRETFTTKRVKNGVEIRAKIERNLTPPKSVTLTTETVQKTWFQIFTEWTSVAKEMEIFDSMERLGGKIEITLEQETALVKLCAQLKLDEVEINREAGNFRVMR